MASLLMCIVFFALLQCVCDWENRDTMFRDVEEIIRRQIKVPFIKMNEISFLIMGNSFPAQLISFVLFPTDVITSKCPTFPCHCLSYRSNACFGNKVSFTVHFAGLLIKE